MASLSLLARRGVLRLATATGARNKHTLPDLPYDYNALEPVVSAEIMRVHHGKHHQVGLDPEVLIFSRLDLLHVESDLAFGWLRVDSLKMKWKAQAYVNGLNAAEEKYAEAVGKADVSGQIALQPALRSASPVPMLTCAL